MNIVVCVKYVPDATANRRFDSDNAVDREGVDRLLSELDEYAVAGAADHPRAPIFSTAFASTSERRLTGPRA